MSNVCPSSDDDIAAVTMPGAAFRAICARASAAAPDEACGLLLGTRSGTHVEVCDVVRADNVAVDRRRRFRIAPGDWLAADRSARQRGFSVIGVWHSHPGGLARPSAADVAGSLPGSLHLIVVPAAGDGEARAGFFSVREGEAQAMPWTLG